MTTCSQDVSAETKTKTTRTAGPNLVERARRAIADLDRAYDVAVAETSDIGLDALTAMYRVIQDFQSDPDAAADFVQRESVKAHGNVRNPVQPVVKALFNSRHAELRTRVTKYAACIAFGIGLNLKPDEFRNHVKSTPQGVNGVYSAYVKSAKRNDRTKAIQITEQEKLTSQTNQFLATGCRLPASELTEGYRPGELLLVLVRVDEDGAVARAFDLTHGQVQAYADRRIGRRS
jgi:hypothetical protein